MSFIIRPIVRMLGLTPKLPPMPALPPPPTPDNSAQKMDEAAQQAAASVQRGRTSTLLTGGEGVKEDVKNTSKVLLGQ